MRRYWTIGEKGELTKLFHESGMFGAKESLAVSKIINRSTTAVQLMALKMGLLKKKKPLDNRACKLCGNMFQPSRKEIETCGHSCRASIQSSKAKEKYPETKTCLMCGKQFLIKRSSTGMKQNYCSAECVGKYACKFTNHKRVPLSRSRCSKCGLEFEFKRFYKRKFCSRPCSESSDKTIESVRESARKRMKSLPSPYSNCKSGWVEIGGKRFFSRSSWEKKYAEVLQSRKDSGEIYDWHYEHERFWFEETTSFVRSYLPDFLVINIDGSKEYHEVKGWMTKRSIESIRLMGQVFPNISLKILDEKWFRENGLA